MRKNLLLLLFILISLVAAKAQEVDSLAIQPTAVATKQAQVEWQKVNYRIPTEEQIAKYQDDSRFQYERTFWGARIIEKLIYYFNYFMYKISQIVPAGQGVSKIIVYGIPSILIIILIVFIFLKVKKIKLKTLFGKKKLDIPDIDFYTEDVNEMNFDTLIASAMKNKNYRLVVRFLYLKNLKVMSDNRLINWNINKTNMSYLHEINNSEVRREFIDITLIFDYVWYGEFPIDETQFSVVENKMKSFNNLALHNEN